MFFQSYTPFNFPFYPLASSTISLSSKCIDPISSSFALSSSYTLKTKRPPTIGNCAGTRNS